MATTSKVIVQIHEMTTEILIDADLQKRELGFISNTNVLRFNENDGTKHNIWMQDSTGVTFDNAITLSGAITASSTMSIAGMLTANGGITLGAGDDLIGSSTSDITFNTDKFKWNSANNRLGIGTASPDGTLHVHTATAGVVTADTNADDLVVENSTSGGISILVPDAGQASFYFGSVSDNLGSEITWNHSNTTMRLGTKIAGGILVLESANGTSAITINASQIATFSGGATLAAGADLIGSSTSDININSGAFFASGANSNVGIGTASPSGALDIVAPHSGFQGVALTPDLTMTGGTQTGAIVAVNIAGGTGSITTQDATITYGSLSSVFIGEPNISKGATDTITVAANLIVNTAPTEGQDNYSLWVIGETRHDEDVRILADNKKVFFGASNDASIYFDATDLVINPREVGAGILKITQTTAITGALSTTDNITVDVTNKGLIVGDGVTSTASFYHNGTDLVIDTSTNDVLLYASGGKKITVSTADVTFNTAIRLVTAATSTTRAGFNLPHGTAPTSPQNGDMWTTTSGLHVRINGTTLNFTTST